MSGWTRRGRALFFLTFTLACGAGDANAADRQAIDHARRGMPAGDYLSGLAASAANDFREASARFRRAVQRRPNDPELTRIAIIASAANGDVAEGIKLIRRLNPGEINGPLLRLVAAIESIRRREWAVARKELSPSGDEGSDLTILVLRAWLHAGSREYDQALDTIDQIHDPRFERFRDYQAGLIAELAGYGYEARKRFRSAHAAGQTSFPLATAWAGFLSRHGEETLARKVLDDFSRLASRAEAGVAETRRKLARGQLPLPARNATEGVAEVLFEIGSSTELRNDPLFASACLNLALYLRPGQPRVIAALADLRGRQKQDAEAIRLYEAVPRRSPWRINSESQIAMLLQRQGQADRALGKMKQVARAWPGNLLALSSLADLYKAQGKWADAEREYSKVIDLIGSPGPADWPWFFERGVVREQSGKWPLAEADFRKALELAPGQSMVQNELGYTWADRGEHLAEARDLIRRAVDSKPDDGNIVDSLGWVLFRLGKTDEAIATLERAASLAPAEPAINEHLGDVYAAAGRLLEAVFQWSHARDLNPGAEMLQRINEKIEKFQNSNEIRQGHLD